MLYEKSELEQYFKDEINRISSIEIEQIESEIAEIRNRAIQTLEAEAQREAGILREQEIKELISEHAIRLSRLHEETSRKLMAKRKELSAQVFTEVRNRVQNFTEGKEYEAHLMTKAKELGTYSFADACIYMRKEDMRYADNIEKAYGRNCSIKEDEEIICGGLRLECEANGIVIDETFDTAIEEQKDWFYTNSGLFVK